MKNTLVFASVLFLFSCSHKAFKDNTTSTASPQSYPGHSLVWADEFNGTDVDTASWTFEKGNGQNGWGNNELQYYTGRPENVRIQDGKLLITARKERYESFDYTSARMVTMDKREFKFGRIDIRAKLPEGQGIWPALWMLGTNFDKVGWPKCGEIDIMELLGHQPSQTHSTVHFGSDWSTHDDKGKMYSISPGKFSERFHLFSMQWTLNSIHFFVDDQKFFEVNPSTVGEQAYPFNQDFFFLINLAVGGNWPGSPDETTLFPQTLEVDYIRVFQKN